MATIEYGHGKPRGQIRADISRPGNENRRIWNSKDFKNKFETRVNGGDDSSQCIGC